MIRKCPVREQAKNYDYGGTSPQRLVFLETYNNRNHIITVLKTNKNYIKNPIKDIFSKNRLGVF